MSSTQILLRLALISLIACVFESGISAAPSKPEPGPEVVLGYVAKGTVYTLTRSFDKDNQGEDPPLSATLQLTRRPLAAAGKKDRIDHIHDFADPLLPIRFRIHGDRLFEASYAQFRQVDLTEMDKLYDSGEAAYRDPKTNDVGLSVSIDSLSPARWEITPVEDLLLEIANDLKLQDNDAEHPLNHKALATLMLGYDLLPTGKDRAKLFWLHKGVMRVADGKNRVVKTDKFGNKECKTTWAKPASFKVPFGGHFHAFARGDDYFFVTRAGAVYHSPKPAKAAARTAKAVDLDSRLADLALHDAKSGKTFVFCLAKRVNGKAREGLYLELAPGKKPRKLKAGDVEVLHRGKPIGAVWSAARLLRADKAID